MAYKTENLWPELAIRRHFSEPPLSVIPDANKPEIRISKLETNSNDQNRSMTETFFGFENSCFEFVSDFVLRISNFSPFYARL